MTKNISEIQLPTRPQVDTLIALFILREFAKDKFKGLDEAKIIINPIIDSDTNFEKELEKGTLIIDLGDSPFNHHNTNYPTASSAAAAFVQKLDDPALQKLLKIAERSDKEGKGTLSEDPLDRAFGFDGFVMTLNKVHQTNPHVVIDSMMPLIEAHYAEQYKQHVGLPELWKKLLHEKKAEVYTIVFNGRRVNIAFFESEDSSLPGFLRAYKGEKCELIVQRLPSSHVNIMTKMNNGLDLKPLAILLRRSELVLTKKPTLPIEELSKSGRIPEAPQWYYDTVTNSLLNGGLNPQSISPTNIPWQSFKPLIFSIWR